MTSCAIMQPTYLPWAGYFNLMASVDTFVLLDDVQYERRSWQSENRVLQSGLVKKIKVPVGKHPQTEMLRNITIDYNKGWIAQHRDIINSSYMSCVGVDVVRQIVFPQIESRLEYLPELTSVLVKEFAQCLGIRTKILLASSLACGGRRSTHLAKICQAVNASDYVAPQGSRDYLEADRFADTSGVNLHFHSFDARPYAQLGAGEFVSHLSVIDVLANCGTQFATSYILKGC